MDPKLARQILDAVRRFEQERSEKEDFELFVESVAEMHNVPVDHVRDLANDVRREQKRVSNTVRLAILVFVIAIVLVAGVGIWSLPNFFRNDDEAPIQTRRKVTTSRTEVPRVEVPEIQTSNMFEVGYSDIVGRTLDGRPINWIVYTIRNKSDIPLDKYHILIVNKRNKEILYDASSFGFYPSRDTLWTMDKGPLPPGNSAFGTVALKNLYNSGDPIRFKIQVLYDGPAAVVGFEFNAPVKAPRL